MDRAKPSGELEVRDQICLSLARLAAFWSVKCAACYCIRGLCKAGTFMQALSGFACCKADAALRTSVLLAAVYLHNHRQVSALAKHQSALHAGDLSLSPASEQSHQHVEVIITPGHTGATLTLALSPDSSSVLRLRPSSAQPQATPLSLPQQALEELPSPTPKPAAPQHTDLTLGALPMDCSTATAAPDVQMAAAAPQQHQHATSRADALEEDAAPMLTDEQPALLNSADTVRADGAAQAGMAERTTDGMPTQTPEFRRAGLCKET